MTRATESFEFDRVRRMVRKIPRDARSLLDVGCRFGRNLVAFAEVLPSARLVGTDIAPNAVEYIRNLGFEGQVCDASVVLPFENDSFDVVTCGEVLEHVINTDRLLEEVRRTLHPDGLAILTTPNLAYFPNRALLLLGIQPIFTETSLKRNMGRMTKWLGQGTPTQGHLKIFTLPALKELLADCGLRIQSIEGYRFVDSGPAALIDALLRLKPSFAAGFIVCARRTSR